MSNYVSVGITDMDLIYKAPTTSTGPSGTDPFTMLFDALDRAGLELSNALTDPKVQQFIREAGVGTQEALVEQKRRKQKSNALLWGGVAVGVAFLLFRKK